MWEGGTPDDFGKSATLNLGRGGGQQIAERRHLRMSPSINVSPLQNVATSECCYLRTLLLQIVTTFERRHLSRYVDST